MAEIPRRKRIGQAIGRNLPMPVCRLLTWAAQRWAPGLWQDALKEAEATQRDGTGCAT